MSRQVLRTSKIRIKVYTACIRKTETKKKYKLVVLNIAKLTKKVCYGYHKEADDKWIFTTPARHSNGAGVKLQMTWSPLNIEC